MNEPSSFLQYIRFDERGLIPAISQSISDGRVLMQVYLSEEAIQCCIETGWLHYYHLGMRKVSQKGESSGHRQRIHSIRLSCDGRSLLFAVEPLGGACEEGYQSCFYREWKDGTWTAIEDKVFDPELVYPEYAFSH